MTVRLPLTTADLLADLSPYRRYVPPTPPDFDGPVTVTIRGTSVTASSMADLVRGLNFLDGIDARQTDDGVEITVDGSGPVLVSATTGRECGGT